MKNETNSLLEAKNKKEIVPRVVQLF